ncbi:hypothetical protein [Lysobacter gummosus]|uniref:hypothetical protein n=1 Tax=Lysobacter gummosus TaxID=262324 RepID=UPI003638F429
MSRHAEAAQMRCRACVRTRLPRLAPAIARGVDERHVCPGRPRHLNGAPVSAGTSAREEWSQMGLR